MQHVNEIAPQSTNTYTSQEDAYKRIATGMLKLIYGKEITSKWPELIEEPEYIDEYVPREIGQLVDLQELKRDQLTILGNFPIKDET